MVYGRFIVKLNLANQITMVRIFLAPVVMIFLLVRFDMGEIQIGTDTLTVSELIAASVFIIAAISDGLDGYIARKNRMVTRLGKLLDPLADKLLITAALVSLVQMQRLEAWIAIVIISREFSVTGLRLIAAAENKVITASALGKVKTIMQILSITSIMLKNFPFSTIYFPFSVVTTWLAVFITILSGLDYFYKNRNIVFTM